MNEIVETAARSVSIAEQIGGWSLAILGLVALSVAAVVLTRMLVAALRAQTEMAVTMAGAMREAAQAVEGNTKAIEGMRRMLEILAAQRR